MLGRKFKNKAERAAELVTQNDPMTLAMALLKSAENLSDAYDNGCGNDLDVENILQQSIGSNEDASGDDSYAALARALTADQQEKLLTAMMRMGTLSVHVDQLHETFTVEDVYDNSGEAKGNSGLHGTAPDTSKLTIIYCAGE